MQMAVTQVVGGQGHPGSFRFLDMVGQTLTQVRQILGTGEDVGLGIESALYTKLARGG